MPVSRGSSSSNGVNSKNVAVEELVEIGFPKRVFVRSFTFWGNTPLSKSDMSC